MSNLQKWQAMANRLRQKKEDAERRWQEHVGGPAEETKGEPAEDPDSPQKPPDDTIKDRCGIWNTKYGQQGVLIIDKDGRRWGIRYPADGAVRWYEPCTLVWFFDDRFEENGELKSATMRVTIIGIEGSEAELEKMQMLLALNKWVRLHNVNGDVIREIRIEKVEEDGEE